MYLLWVRNIRTFFKSLMLCCTKTIICCCCLVTNGKQEKFWSPIFVVSLAPLEGGPGAEKMEWSFLPPSRWNTTKLISFCIRYSINGEKEKQTRKNINFSFELFTKKKKKWKKQDKCVRKRETRILRKNNFITEKKEMKRLGLWLVGCVRKWCSWNSSNSAHEFRCPALVRA